MKINIQGYGSVSAAGNDPPAAWIAYTAGEPTWLVDGDTGLPVYRVKNLPTEGKLAEFTATNSSDRASVLALHAAEQAVNQAGWKNEDFSIIVGCSRGPTVSWEESYDEFLEHGQVKPLTSPRTTLGGIGFALSKYFGTSALASSLSVTCSSGMHAILHGLALLRAGMAKRVLVGGAEAPLTTFTLRQLEALRIYAGVPEAGNHACLPFSEPATGMVVGEGAGFVALSMGGLSSTGTDVPDFSGTSTDVPEMTLEALTFTQENSPTATGISTKGQGLQKTMNEILSDYGQPDIIIAHAPGTKRGDAAEAAAIKAVFGDQPPPITSYKPFTGHTFGASGPLAITAALSAIEAGNIESALINATGFGGNVVSILVDAPARRAL